MCKVGVEYEFHRKGLSPLGLIRHNGCPNNTGTNGNNPRDTGAGQTFHE